MEEFYGIWSMGDCYSPMILASSDCPSPAYVAGFGLEEEEADLISDSTAPCMAALEMEEDVQRVVKSSIEGHPQYPRLLQAYVDCQKVGASGEIVGFLDGIMRDHKNEGSRKGSGCRVSMGVDPELDNFMETYTEILMKYREDLERTFNEANAFLEKTERQLSSLCNPPFPFPSSSSSDDGTDEELWREDVEAQEAKPRGCEDRDRDLKDRLLERFRSQIGTLKMEFSKKRKKGKLPQEARQVLLKWWNVHNKWPYPTEADKITLAESAGLDQKQINNWFINQRKRHWKPSESLQFALTDDCPGQFNATD